jgi:Asp-tRNA(Asn)/Glu-tRNA(Gln) amidotransferase A subunit family amidase
MGTFVLKPTSRRVAKITQDGIWDLLDSVTSISASRIEDLAFFLTNLMSPESHSLDSTLPPIPFNNMLYQDAVNSKKMIIGFFVDDGILRACPTSRRAVFLAAAALHQQGHTIVRFTPPSTKKAYLLMSKLFSYNKSNPRCLRAKIKDFTSYLTSILSIYSLLKIPRIVKGAIGWILGHGMNDTLLKELSWSVGGNTAPRKSRSVLDLELLNEEREEYSRIFDAAWKQPNLDALICPVHACPPMPARSWPFTWIGSFYSSLFSLLDYPVGTIPQVTTVQPEDVVSNSVQYVHDDRYMADSNRPFNFLGVLALEEMNAALRNGTIVNLPVSIQVVAKPYHEEVVLAIMQQIQSGISNGLSNVQ